MTLDAIPQKTQALVVSVETSGSSGLRLMELGIIPGASLHVVKSAPLGDPIQISLRGSHLAVRRAEARAIHVMLCEE